jgi:dihydrolipoamide dehydrogenase
VKFFDIAIIGGGPGGYTAALKAVENGKSVALFEENFLGGTCLNAGCIPTKAALNMAKNYARAKAAVADGYVVSASDFRFDFEAANKKKNETVQKIRDNLTKYLIRSKITIIIKKAVLKKIPIEEELYNASHTVGGADGELYNTSYIIGGADGELYNDCYNNRSPHPYAPPTEGNYGKADGELYNASHKVGGADGELYNTSYIIGGADGELDNNCHNNRSPHPYAPPTEGNYGKADGELDNTSRVIIEADGELYNASYIIIASGGKRARYAIDGIDLAYSSDKWTKEFPDADGGEVVVIGGGAVGLELASFYAMTGAKITMIMMEERPLPTCDKDISLTLQMILKKKGILLKTSSVVKSVEKTGENLYTVRFECGGESFFASGNLVVDASGRLANTDLGLENVGVKYDKKGIFTDENLMTNIKNIYVVGDAARGNIQLAHKAAFDGERVVGRILSGDLESVDKNPVVPICIYTVPEIAAAGMTSDDCSAADAEYYTGKAMMAANGKAGACDAEQGFLKVVFAKIDCEKKALSGVKYKENKKDKFRLVGAHIIAENSSEIIGGLAQLVASGAEKEEILNTPFPHPSISEAFIEAVKNAKEKI